MADEQSAKKRIRIKQFCDLYSVSRSTAYRLFERGEITPIRKGGIVLLDVAQIERWAAESAA